MSSRRIESREFVGVLPGYYGLAAEPVPLAEVARAAQEHLVPHGILSHLTAAELLGMPLPRRLSWGKRAQIHVDVEPSRRRTGSRGLVVHTRPRRRPVRLISGLMIADPLEVLLDLAGILVHDDLVACIDALGSLRRRDVRIPVETARSAAQGMTGRHVKALRRAARDARDAVDSPRETMTRLLLVRRGYPEPLTNRPIIDRDTGVTYYLDLSYGRWRIAIEYDGKDHFDPERIKRDRAKDETLHEQNWSVLRITSHDLDDPRRFLTKLDATIAAAKRREGQEM